MAFRLHRARRAARARFFCLLKISTPAWVPFAPAPHGSIAAGVDGFPSASGTAGGTGHVSSALLKISVPAGSPFAPAPHGSIAAGVDGFQAASGTVGGTDIFFFPAEDKHPQHGFPLPPRPMATGAAGFPAVGRCAASRLGECRPRGLCGAPTASLQSIWLPAICPRSPNAHRFSSSVTS